MGRQWVERYGIKSNVKLGRFWSQLQASYVSCHTEEFRHNETVRLWTTLYIYIYIYGNKWTECERMYVRRKKGICLIFPSSYQPVFFRFSHLQALMKTSNFQLNQKK